MKVGSVRSSASSVCSASHSCWWVLRGGLDGGEWGTNELALSMAGLYSVLPNGQGDIDRAVDAPCKHLSLFPVWGLHFNHHTGFIIQLLHVGPHWQCCKRLPLHNRLMWRKWLVLDISKSVILLWNNLFTWQNNSLCGKHSRWGLWGIIRPQTALCWVKPQLQLSPVEYHTHEANLILMCYSHRHGQWNMGGPWIRHIECCINGWRVWDLAAIMRVNMSHVQEATVAPGQKRC